MDETVWKPFKRQIDFLSLPDSIFEGFYGGAAGGGKSELLLMLPIAREFIKNPRFKGLILRRTFPELDKEIILRSREYYGLSGALPYSDEKKRWVWPWGSVIQFGHAEYERDIRKYDTAEYNYIAFDELTSFTEFQYMYLAMTRCRSSSPELPAIVRSASNPGNVGHGFVRKRFVEPAPSGGVIIRDSVSGMKRIYIPSKVQDNPHIMKSDPTYVNRMMMLPEAERRAKLDGDWWTFSGQVFDEWRDEKMPDEPPNARHVIEPFEIPSWWPRILAIDWGFAAMIWAGWFALAPDGRVYVYREYAARREKVSTWAANVGRLSKGENLVDVVLDPSAWDNRGDDKTIAEQFMEYSKLEARKAANDRISGKVLVQEYLRWKPRPPREVPPEGYSTDVAVRIFRWQGLEAYEAYNNLFREDKEDVAILPRLQVFNTCTELRRAIPLCVYDENRKEDVAPFDGDDPYDGLRYGLQACERASAASAEGVKLRQQLEKVLKLRETSPTSFYIQMDKVEKEMEAEDSPAPLVRGGRRAQYDHSDWER